jgi:ABC-2 type transport system permease protein
VNFVVRCLFGMIPLMATLYLWRSVYGGKGAGGVVEGYSLAGMTSYYLIMTIVDSLTAVTDDDFQIAADIKDGRISQFLLKPVDYLTYRLCVYFAGRVVYTLMTAVPFAIFIYALREYWVDPPAWPVFLAALLSVALAGLLQFFISYTMALLAFWVMEVSTFIYMVFAFEYLAGGRMFPLDILPGFWGHLLLYTPFPYLLYFPVSVYLGQSTGGTLWRGLATQVCWVVAAYVLARVVWARGIKKYSAAGG